MMPRMCANAHTHKRLLSKCELHRPRQTKKWLCMSQEWVSFLEPRVLQLVFFCEHAPVLLQRAINFSSASWIFLNPVEKGIKFRIFLVKKPFSPTPVHLRLTHAFLLVWTWVASCQASSPGRPQAHPSNDPEFSFDVVNTVAGAACEVRSLGLTAFGGGGLTRGKAAWPGRAWSGNKLEMMERKSPKMASLGLSP